MKCKCGNEFAIKLGSKADTQGCKILTSMTTIVTAQCLKCGEIFQIPLQSNALIIQKKDMDEEQDN